MAHFNLLADPKALVLVGRDTSRDNVVGALRLQAGRQEPGYP